MLTKLIKFIQDIFTLPEMPAQCIFCGRVFDTEHGLDIHIGLKHKEIKSKEL